MSQKITFYPLGNAETCLIELNSGKKYYLIMLMFTMERTQTKDTTLKMNCPR